MRRLYGEFYFRIPDLLAAPSVLGRTFDFFLSDGSVTVALPASNSDSSFRVSDRVAVLEEFNDHVWTEDLVVEDHDDIQAIRTLKVTVRFEHPGSDRDSWTSAVQLSEEGLRRFIDWVRINTAQAAITAGPDAIRCLPDSHLVDETNGLTLHRPRFRRLTLRFPPDPSQLDTGGADGVADLLALPPPLAERLLADARYSLWYARPSDPGKALILMGSALELKARLAARQVGIAPARAVKKASFSAFIGDTMAFYGRSLEAEDRPLLKEAIAAYRARNRFAHTGAPPSWQDATAHLQAAAKVMTWLESL